MYYLHQKDANNVPQNEYVQPQEESGIYIYIHMYKPPYEEEIRPKHGRAKRLSALGTLGFRT